MTHQQEYDRFIQLHRIYEVKNMQVILKEFRKIFKAINFDNLTPENARFVILLNLDTEGLEKALYRIYYTTGIKYGNIVSRQIRSDNPIEQKRFKPLPFFNTLFQQFLTDYFKAKGGENISLLTDTMVDEIQKVIVLSTELNETVEQMRDRIYKTVNKPDFYKWQAMRIARTETTFAMNKAKELSGQASGLIMEKVWLGKNDGRERPSHIAMNGKKVEQNAMFELSSGVKLKFPGDRDGIGRVKDMKKEVINCRCTYGYEAKRDENGRLFFVD